jgi:carbon monoxide dehydrogenase subunit G
MAVELDHSFTTAKPAEETYATILDLDRIVPCVQGGRVLERTGEESVKAEIKVKMGAMGLTYTGTLDVTERDPDAHRVVMTVKSREAGGQGHANATITFLLSDGGGTIHTTAQITGKAASMGEGIMTSILDALIADFAAKVGAL